MNKAGMFIGNTFKSVATAALTTTIPVYTGAKAGKICERVFDQLAAEVYPKKRFFFFKGKPKK